jgi:diguanylate cyclase (GGDEF)-like protein/putative nucleotidyltransferase with HDIG domain
LSYLKGRDVSRLKSLLTVVGDRAEIAAVTAELAALRRAYDPLLASFDPATAAQESEKIFPRLNAAIGALSASVAKQKRRATQVANGGTVAIIVTAALILAATLRRLERRRRREAEQHALELRRLALRDPLTGLPNRRQLRADLSEAIGNASLEHPLELMFFDLDGFKAYNDRFGHYEGDLLLRCLGEALADAASPAGSAYRLGGDEFCALVSTDDPALARRLREALGSEGDGYAIRASMGSVLLPTETRDARTAMQLADARMYAQKEAGRLSPARQVRRLALELLGAHDSGVVEHSRRVGALANELGRRLGISGQALSELTSAAELHDIGKLAIPRETLEKPGPLSEQEWQLVRRHPVLGAEILRSAPALSSLAEIVQSSHERFDGGGYPSGLRGEEIPLSSRIIFVCDAYDAMTSERPYRASVSERIAIDELQRCAGSQFDPRVVQALAESRGDPISIDAPARTLSLAKLS